MDSPLHPWGAESMVSWLSPSWQACEQGCKQVSQINGQEQLEQQEVKK